MDEKVSGEALTWQVTWKTLRYMFAGIGWGGLGTVLLILSDALPRGWKPAAAVALIALAQIRVIVRGGRYMAKSWRLYQQTFQELLSLVGLEGFAAEHRRTELKKLDEAYFSAAFTQLIPIAFSLWVLYECVLILPRLGIGITFPEWVPPY